MLRLRAAFVLLLVLAAACSGCSIRRFAVNRVGDALSGGGSVYESDDDMELVGDALPFSLKLLESLLAESPQHVGMLETACKGFATYGYVYVEQEAATLSDANPERALQLRERSRRLYLRASRYGLRALEVEYPGIAERLTADPRGATAAVRIGHVSLLYWNAVALGLAISASKHDASMLARLPEVDAMLARALELDESWNAGALHELNLSLAAARPTASDHAQLERHYERALDLSAGARASLFVTCAEAIAVPGQDVARFRRLLELALAVDADAHEPDRLANLVAQRRARWLLAHVDDLFLDVGDGDEATEGRPR
jgi:predicted anti-sigma-YlaC factor YlaD